MTTVVSKMDMVKKLAEMGALDSYKKDSDTPILLINRVFRTVSNETIKELYGKAVEGKKADKEPEAKLPAMKTEEVKVPAKKKEDKKVVAKKQVIEEKSEEVVEEPSEETKIFFGENPLLARNKKTEHYFQPVEVDGKIYKKKWVYELLEEFKFSPLLLGVRTLESKKVRLEYHLKSNKLIAISRRNKTVMNTTLCICGYITANFVKKYSSM